MKAKLEKTTEAFIKDLESKGGAPIYKLTPVQARAVLEKAQSGPVEMPAVDIEEKSIPCGLKGMVSITIVRPEQVSEQLPVILFFHGAGWVMGSFNTHERLVRELAVRTHSAVVFVNYPLSPEARFPIAVEEAYDATQYIAENGSKFNLDTSRIAVCGDSVGGNMAIAVTLLAKERKGPKIDRQILFYPVTSSEMKTPSYAEFANGPWLTKAAMQWFWDAYETNVSARKDILCSPLQASMDQLKGLPTALIITAENDVLRDEGELYAAKLMVAGVNVTATRFLGTIHDFVMLNALANTPAAIGAITLASQFINKAWGTKKSIKSKKKVA